MVVTDQAAPRESKVVLPRDDDRRINRREPPPRRGRSRPINESRRPRVAGLSETGYHGQSHRAAEQVPGGRRSTRRDRSLSGAPWKELLEPRPASSNGRLSRHGGRTHCGPDTPTASRPSRPAPRLARRSHPGRPGRSGSVFQPHARAGQEPDAHGRASRRPAPVAQVACTSLGADIAPAVTAAQPVTPATPPPRVGPPPTPRRPLPARRASGPVASVTWPSRRPAARRAAGAVWHPSPKGRASRTARAVAVRAACRAGRRAPRSSTTPSAAASWATSTSASAVPTPATSRAGSPWRTRRSSSTTLARAPSSGSAGTAGWDMQFPDRSEYFWARQSLTGPVFPGKPNGPKFAGGGTGPGPPKRPGDPETHEGHHPLPGRPQPQLQRTLLLPGGGHRPRQLLHRGQLPERQPRLQRLALRLRQHQPRHQGALARLRADAAHLPVQDVHPDRHRPRRG